MIAIVDYGLGNVRAFANIYQRFGIPCRVAATPPDLADASRIILPGVGAFDWAMRRLTESGLRPALESAVLGRQCPILGVCVGMQMLARRSDEGSLPGLGWIPAEVRRFDVARFTGPTHLPHMGWNDIAPARPDPLLEGLDADARFYFLHSYYFAPEDGGDVLTTTDYHGVYASGVRRGAICGVQFHPEKSHRWGERLLQNFAAI